MPADEKSKALIDGISALLAEYNPAFKDYVFVHKDEIEEIDGNDDGTATDDGTGTEGTDDKDAVTGADGEQSTIDASKQKKGMFGDTTEELTDEAAIAAFMEKLEKGK